MKQYFGKYRGTVANNIDPMNLGRIQVEVPAVLGDGRMSWAMPCVPYAGNQVGIYTIPPIGGNVWVEFEGGDPDYPIWAGCFWGQGELPDAAGIPTTLLLQTDGVKLEIGTAGGGLAIEVSPPAASTTMSLDLVSSGIQLKNGSSTIELSPTSVTVNDGALEVI